MLSVLALALAVAPPAPSFEHDRAAIRAMAGRYRVTFGFAETVAFQPGYTLHAPHRSQASELVLVIEDSGRVIELQHVLVVGAGQKPIKHWRQRWEYEPAELLEYRGERTFARRRVAPDEARGAWSQSVFEVDDAPRYQALGRWRHAGGASSWESAETWRPLPRREYTTRSDYQALGCRNRHTLAADGWFHEQDNVKLQLRADGPRALAREAGLNRYERAPELDLSAAEAYWQATREFWADVRAAWRGALRGDSVVVEDQDSQGRRRHEILVELADRARRDPAARDEAARVVAGAVQAKPARASAR
jgi:hypothetical protein